MIHWCKNFNEIQINEVMNQNTLMQALGIEITSITETSLIGTMPVDHRTHQPMGFLHGGASVALAETLGSMASWMTIDDSKTTFGMDIQANHIRPVQSGIVTGEAVLVHAGKTTQIWDINITNDDKKLVCVSRITMAIKDL